MLEKNVLSFKLTAAFVETSGEQWIVEIVRGLMWLSVDSIRFYLASLIVSLQRVCYVVHTALPCRRI